MTLYRYDFAYDTPGLADGIPVFTPQAADVLLDVGFVVHEAFDGTTPLADVSTDSNDGIFYEWYQGVDLATNHGKWVSSAGVDYTGAGQTIAAVTDPPPSRGLWWSVLVRNYGPGGVDEAASYYSHYQRFRNANPLILVVSTTGLDSGDPIGGTQGAASLYLLVASPVVLP